MRTQFLLIGILTVIGGARAASADVFYPFPGPDSVTVTYPDDIGGPYWPEANLIQGAGLGFDVNEPHDKIGGGADANWVTTADCGYPSDYIECVGEPVIELDLGQDRLLKEISTWGYADTNTNGMREFELRFATDAEGPGGYGMSISYNPTFIVDDFFEYDAIERRSFDFSEELTARYVEMTVTDNYFDDPGDGTGENGWGPGGDRVGIGEIAFQAPDDFVPPKPPEPDQFYEIDDIISSTEDFDLWPAANLIQGPGAGFNADQPHQLLVSGEAGSWVTEACGYPCDYLEFFDPPEIIIDLGEDVTLDEIDVWGYSSGNSNGVLEFELEFATNADGDDGFGDTISYNPTFGDVDINPSPRQQFPFDEQVTARFVKFTATDNYFEEPGDGTGDLGRPAGGDRVGLSEIAFPIPSEDEGDYNGDGVLDALDIDLQAAEMKKPAAEQDLAKFDHNNDGVIDVGDAGPNESNWGDRLIWIRTLRGTSVGDVNFDDVFDSGDLVLALQGSKYAVDAGNAQMATWVEGDWNGDMVFDSGDLVFAFQDGQYVAAAAPAAIPEPSALILSLLASLGLLKLRRTQA